MKKTLAVNKKVSSLAELHLIMKKAKPCVTCFSSGSFVTSPFASLMKTFITDFIAVLCKYSKIYYLDLGTSKFEETEHL